MSARQILALLVGVAVHGVIQKIRANAAVIEESVSFAGRAIAGDRFPFTLRRDQELQELALRFYHLLAKCQVVLDAGEAGLLFPRPELGYPGADGLGSVVVMAGVYPERAAVRGQLVDIKYHQTMCLEDPFRHDEGEIREMFVI